MAILKPIEAVGGHVWPLQASEKPPEVRKASMAKGCESDAHLTETMDTGFTDTRPPCISCPESWKKGRVYMLKVK